MNPRTRRQRRRRRKARRFGFEFVSWATAMAAASAKLSRSLATLNYQLQGLRPATGGPLVPYDGPLTLPEHHGDPIQAEQLKRWAGALGNPLPEIRANLQRYWHLVVCARCGNAWRPAEHTACPECDTPAPEVD